MNKKKSKKIVTLNKLTIITHKNGLIKHIPLRIVVPDIPDLKEFRSAAFLAGKSAREAFKP
jgi:hypothetical protein